MPALWQWKELLAACDIDQPQTGPDITGISIDSRTLDAGDLFIALSGDPGPPFSDAAEPARDGHDFIDAAIARGAGGLLVSREDPYEIPALRVKSTLKGLWSLGRYARGRSKALITAITGSSGKTTARHFLQTMLQDQARTHASVGSYNNHWGVPLSLSRMPADTKYGVFEIGMNHPGEICPLAQLVQPHIAMVLNVLPVHIGHFADLDGIRKEKLSIAEGLSETGRLVAPIGLDCTGVSKGKIHTFGFNEEADAFPRDIARETTSGLCWSVNASIRGEAVSFDIQAGANHRVETALACLLVIKLLGADLKKACRALSEIEPPPGRGNEIQIDGITVIDDSYNANPKSMSLALESLAMKQRGSIAILGEMLELGEQSSQYHESLLGACEPISRIICVGHEMKPLVSALQPTKKVQWFESAKEIDLPDLVQQFQEGDTVLVKGSNKVFWKNQFVEKLTAAIGNR